jgi:hypothetical protein
MFSEMDAINRFQKLEETISGTIDTSYQRAELARINTFPYSSEDRIELANYVIYDVCQGEYYDEKTDTLFKFSHIFDHAGNPFDLRLENWE